MDSISSVYNNLYNKQNSNKSADKISDKLKNNDYSKASSDDLMGVCKEFESYFIEQMFKAMEKMVPEHEDDSGSSGMSTYDVFKDKLTQEYASSASKQGGLGIAEILYEQMKRNYNIKDVSDTFTNTGATAAASTGIKE